MLKKKRDVSLPKRFNSEDIKKWQEQANLTTGGNLTLWMEKTLNNAVTQSLNKPVVMAHLVSLREDYLRELNDVSFIDEKTLKPMFQNLESYQQIITQHFLEYVKARL